jgi:UDP-N-acetyl-D-mannosaminuronate dehydrogenase
MVGYGEVGSALGNIIKRDDVKIFDPIKGYESKCECPEVTNICFPFTAGDNSAKMDVIKEWCAKSEVVIVHSTVPIGTCARIGQHNLVYSPVRGRHVTLSQALRTFTKYIAGHNDKAVAKAKSFLESFGMHVECWADYKSLEAAKIFSTTYFGTLIRFMKLTHEFCRSNDLDFDLLYRQWNESYNEGYKAMGDNNVVRPVLTPTPGSIGGHCVVQNCEFIPDFLPAQEIMDFQEIEIEIAAFGKENERR